MDANKLEKWKKWHEKGYKGFMLTHLAGVIGFFCFSGTFAYVQFSMTVPESVKAKGGGMPLWPILVVVLVMVPLSIVVSHFLWNKNENEYAEHHKDKD